jgi:hypothetical protein
MRNTLDNLSTVLGSGLSRRHLLRAVTSTLVATASGAWMGSRRVSNVAQAAPPMQKRRAVVLKASYDDLEHATRVVIPDRLSGAVTVSGQPKVTIVPHVLDEAGAVQLSMYNTSSNMNLVKRLTLAVGADSVRVGSPLMPGLSIAATEILSVETPVEPAEDCCVYCYGIYEWCGCSVCCSWCQSMFGHCCDYGCCWPDPCGEPCK